MKFYEAKLVKIVKENSDSYSYIMNIPQGYAWKAGQHAMFRLKGYTVAPEDKDTRIFTIAAAPEDGYLMFTTRISDKHSSFKDILLNCIKAGDTIEIAPAIGSFDMDLNKFPETLVIAGGIGITPIRSLLRHYCRNNNENHRITVLYSDDRGEFAYGDLWDELTADMPNLDLHLISQREEFAESTNRFAARALNAAEYLIAGSPGMNAAFTETLTDLGIKRDNIKVDNFMGY